MKRVFPVLPGFLMLAVMAGCWWWFRSRPAVAVPAGPAAAVPAECSQLVLVLAGDVNRVPAKVWLLERRHPAESWRVSAGPLAANVGRNGVGWGEGEAILPNPGGFPDKREGDGRSPAGVFTLPWAFGTKPASEAAGVRLPWRECTESLRGVDDAKSRYYNQIVDEAGISDKDWDSAEIMRRPDGLYDEGAAIGHNPGNRPAGGSCIFLHIWSGPGKGTAGCTALSRENVARILRWLDPSKAPRLMLDVEGRES